MTFLPIVERELRVASRKRGTYWMRIGGAIGALLVGGWIMLMMQRLPPQQMGKIIFSALAVLTFIFAACSGIRLTSDCLSEEKRDGTLGLLFLTDLKGYDVVFGKLAANSIGCLYAMLASFPVLAISLLLGGVTYGEFWRVTLVSVNILFLSLSVGMFASSICRDERKSIGVAFIVMLLVCLGPVLAGWLYYYKRSSRFDDTFLLFTPGYACFLAFDIANGAKKTFFWTCTGMTHLYGWLFIFLACRIVPRSWQDKADSRRKQKTQEVLNEVTQGNAANRNAFRTNLLNVNPFYWLASRDRMKPRMLWLFLILTAGVWVWGISKFKNDWFNPGIYVVTALFLHTILKYWLAGEASRRFTDDRRSGALELMLSTPISVQDVLRGQKLALVRQFLGPVLCIAVVDFILMMAGLSEMSSDKSDWILVWIAGIGIFLFDLYALSWLGMWQAMTNQKVNRAAGGAIARILFLPWLAFGLTFAVIAIISLFSVTRQLVPKSSYFDESLITIYWIALSVVNNVIWIAYARKRLNARFREIATQRFDAPRSFWSFAKLSKPPVVAER